MSQPRVVVNIYSSFYAVGSNLCVFRVCKAAHHHLESCVFDRKSWTRKFFSSFFQAYQPCSVQLCVFASERVMTLVWMISQTTVRGIKVPPALASLLCSSVLAV